MPWKHAHRAQKERLWSCHLICSGWQRRTFELSKSQWQLGCHWCCFVCRDWLHHVVSYWLWKPAGHVGFHPRGDRHWAFVLKSEINCSQSQFTKSVVYSFGQTNSKDAFFFRKIKISFSFWILQQLRNKIAVSNRVLHTKSIHCTLWMISQVSRFRLQQDGCYAIIWRIPNPIFPHKRTCARTWRLDQLLPKFCWKPTTSSSKGKVKKISNCTKLLWTRFCFVLLQVGYQKDDVLDCLIKITTPNMNQVSHTWKTYPNPVAEINLANL